MSMDFAERVRRAQAGDVEAFTELVKLLQDLVFGYALTILGDVQTAQDVTQETLVAAYASLKNLTEPKAFISWLRAIARHQCHRVLRRRQLLTVPLDDAVEPPKQNDTETAAADKDLAAQTLKALTKLPLELREVLLLYYMREFTQQQIADFLATPLTKVNNRLHAGRVALRRQMRRQFARRVQRLRLPSAFAQQIGKLIAVHGPLVEAQFSRGELPPILSRLMATKGAAVDVTVEVVQRQQNGAVRCVATSSAVNLKAGMHLVPTADAQRLPVPPVRVQAAIRRVAAETKLNSSPVLLETGIKVIDLLCPIVRGSTVALFGNPRIGKQVFVQELVYRLTDVAGGVAFFSFVHTPELAMLRALPPDPAPGRRYRFQTLYFLADDLPNARSAVIREFDVCLQFSQAFAGLGLYPAIDPLASTSRWLQPSVLGRAHFETATRVRMHLRRLFRAQRSETRRFRSDGVMQSRAQKLQFFLSQPFFVAEPYTKTPGRHVPRNETLRACRAILGGDCDSIPAEAFRFAGALREVRVQAHSSVG